MSIYENRATILMEQGIISNKTYINSMNLFAELSKRINLDETHTAFIMHSIMCLERAYSDTQLLDEHQNLKEELIQTIGYDEALNTLKNLEELTEVKLNDSEKTYMLMHLLSLHQ